MPWSRRPKSGGQAAAGAMPKRGAAEASVLSWCRDLVARVNALEDGMRALGDAELADVTATLRASYQAGEPLDTLAPEAFAVVREAAVRTLGQRPHDEQVMGAAVLHLGKVTEMRTGEGKTLTATLPAYLHALAGDGVQP